MAFQRKRRKLSPAHPDPHKQKRMEFLRERIAMDQRDLAELAREAKRLRKPASSATVAPPLPRRRVAGASQPPP